MKYTLAILKGILDRPQPSNNFVEYLTFNK